MSTVDLGEDLGIESSTELKNRLAPLLAEAAPVVLDASRVSRIHTAAVQVLCAFVHDRRSAGRPTQFSGCTATFSDAARLLGVSQALGLDVPHDNLNSVENAA
ncbi:STAS domain-containing protein [Stenotrophomonas sp. 169]|uniref:STAS domain-containing protein n=1 Tax=unclassified Stenotrophomonas TaxID=196198 RepID=UPI0016623790|nr:MULTISPECIES: STAS domain-containing protein [unclassified Stenotrophomonas]MBD8634358.1 STAS domain-containing protein [Stenotrophomonas sp. CFBP 13725]MBD8694758.1 STAS domain-containing protein [Stenotrophomonas sp. CFBP 13718]QNR95912.1 STAS domain-containing protein [Stenotrophomonas sp. 169]